MTQTTNMTAPGPEKLKEIYVTMKRCRAFDERVREEYAKANIRAFAHMSVGQEGVVAGVCSMLREDDYTLGSHRAHALVVARGADFKRLMAELFGRVAGYSRGRAGSLHMHNVEKGVLLCVGMVASQIPIASGVALGCKKQKQGRITVCFFGDGASNTGAFHEAVGMAAAFDLPILFVCENNQYAVSAYWKDYMKIENISDRAKGYGIPGISVDGMDAAAVAEATSKAVERIRNGGGPVLLEGHCYRFFGHAAGLYTESYRDPNEAVEWKKRDPLKRLYLQLVERDLVTEEEDKHLDEALAAELDEAVRFALASPEAGAEEALVDLLCD